MVARAIVGPGRPPSNPSARLATVARARASEQSAMATAAPDLEAARVHLEQEAHLVRLAEIYERQARDGATPF